MMDSSHMFQVQYVATMPNTLRFQGRRKISLGDNPKTCGQFRS